MDYANNSPVYPQRLSKEERERESYKMQSICHQQAESKTRKVNKKQSEKANKYVWNEVNYLLIDIRTPTLSLPTLKADIKNGYWKLSQLNKYDQFLMGRYPHTYMKLKFLKFIGIFWKIGCVRWLNEQVQ